MAIAVITATGLGVGSAPVGAAAMNGQPGAGAGLTVTPKVLVFSPADVGKPCGQGGCTYASVTISNGTKVHHKMTDFSATEPFWSTSAGTCNDPDDFLIPAHTSCSLQFGFQPKVAGRTYKGTGTIDFVGGIVLTFELRGTARAA